MEKKIVKKRQRKYDAQFKAEALKQIENGQRVSAVAQALGISEALLYQWRKRGTISQPGNSSEVEVLRKQVKQLETERDILKKALTIFSR
jgi:transposase